MTNPTAGEILNPIPENPATMCNPSTAGIAPNTGRDSGVMSYTPVIPRITSAL